VLDDDLPKNQKKLLCVPGGGGLVRGREWAMSCYVAPPDKKKGQRAERSAQAAIFLIRESTWRGEKRGVVQRRDDASSGEDTKNGGRG